MQIINCHGWESNPGFLERKSGSKPTEPLMAKSWDNLTALKFWYSQDGLHNHPLRILHHQPAHTHSIVVAFNLSQFTAAIDEINHVITHGNKCK